MAIQDRATRRRTSATTTPATVTPAPKAKKKQAAVATGVTITTPSGTTTATSGDLIEAVKEAAREAGLSKFKLFVNGEQVLRPGDIPHETLEDLIEATTEGQATISILRYDRAG